MIAAAGDGGACGTPLRNCACTWARRARLTSKLRFPLPTSACRLSAFLVCCNSPVRRGLDGDFGDGAVADVDGGHRMSTRPIVACTRGLPLTQTVARRHPLRPSGCPTTRP